MKRRLVTRPISLIEVVRTLAPGILTVMLVSACASSNPADEPAAVDEPVPVATSEPAPPPAPAPVYRSEPAEKPVRLNPEHPERYVVKKGDTLWDISDMFLKDPWFWPEIWYVNPQIANPHLIYPGDVISLVYIDGKPRLILERGNAVRLSPRIREEALDEAIFTVPYEAIKAFLSKPAILDKKTAHEAPYILTTQHGHLVHGAGASVYVRGADFGEGSVYSVMHVGEELRDPETREVLGYDGIYVAEGTIERTGDPATMMLNASAREALNGDRLIEPADDFPLRFTPRSPSTEISGHIIGVHDGVSVIGNYQVVALDRGLNDGLELGNVLAVYQSGRVAKDRFAERGFFSRQFPEKVQLPNEYSGLLMVFRAFDDMSYGIIVKSISDIHVLDTVQNP
jgi:hypothetical protein